MIQIEQNAYQADEGKVFKNINSGLVLGNEIWFGTNDSISNYIEIDATIPEEEPTIPIQTVEERLESIDTLIQDLQSMYFGILLEV